MLLEILLVFLILGAIAATVLSFFVVRSNKRQAHDPSGTQRDADNPQRDTDVL